ncbi:MAG: hypothetical protein SPL54_01430, partial [Lachnospiraceae bacterium]|nr:hypothetical protein [Lachnospiraceae bacterium]
PPQPARRLPAVARQSIVAITFFFIEPSFNFLHVLKSTLAMQLIDLLCNENNSSIWLPLSN